MCYHSDLAISSLNYSPLSEVEIINESDAHDVMQESNRVLINKEEDYNPEIFF